MKAVRSSSPYALSLLMGAVLLAASACGGDSESPESVAVDVAAPPVSAAAQEAERPASDLTPLPGRVLHAASGIVLVHLRAGSFSMGSPLSERLRDGDEAQREVRIERDFYLGETEVSAEQWARVMGQPHEPQQDGVELPVCNITWYEALEFVERLNASGDGGWRLPTEAEWEYACRAGTDTPFAFGEDITSAQVHFNARYPYRGDARGQRPKGSLSVRALPPNAWGLFAMHGNVQEWCQDLYVAQPAGKIAAQIVEKAEKQLEGEAVLEGAPRVFRGGAWVSSADQVRSAYRDGYPPRSDGLEYGFRVARSLRP